MTNQSEKYYHNPDLVHQDLEKISESRRDFFPQLGLTLKLHFCSVEAECIGLKILSNERLSIIIKQLPEFLTF